MPFNHLTPKSDKHLISPKSITPESKFRAERIEEMITVSRNSWLLDKFSWCVPKEMYREQFGEYS